MHVLRGFALNERDQFVIIQFAGLAFDPLEVEHIGDARLANPQDLFLYLLVHP